MGNLHTESGQNNCYYNINGKCTFPKPYSTWVGNSGRAWESNENCTVTQYGAQKLCSNYKIED